MALSENEKNGLNSLAFYQRMYIAKIFIDNDPDYYGYPGADEDREKIKTDAWMYQEKARVLMNELSAQGVPWSEINAALAKGDAEGRALY